MEFEIPTDYFEKIYHLRFESFENQPTIKGQGQDTYDKYIIYVACKKQGIR